MIAKAKFLAQEAKLRVKYFMEKDCLFCKIVAGKITTDVILENDGAIAFNDINPVSDIHILIVPKRHIESVLTIGKDDANDLVAMYDLAGRLVDNKKLNAFRLAFNGGKLQHVRHLHMHLMAGPKIQWNKL